MATNQLNRVIQTLRRAAPPHDDPGLTDGQLLERYVRGREEAAFAALVRRHGPMVWGVCRRVLRNPHDAEDAFQATFLVLVRKAASVVSVANWLYGVAQRTAWKARAAAVRREGREKQVTTMPEPAREQALWDDLQPLLDQELARLPDRYRAVLVLCDLEGKTRKQAARELGCPEGTVAGRLARARGMLAKRLARYGPAVSGGVLAAMLSQNAASAGVPAGVASATIQAATLFAAGQAAAGGLLSGKAVALAEGVLKTMLLSKLKTATALLLAVAVLGTSTAVLTPRVLADRPVAANQEPATPPPPEPKPGEQGATVVTGVVKAVDAGKNAFTISHRDGDKTFTVANDAPVVIGGKPGNLAGLPKGAFVSVSLPADGRTAQKVEAVGPQVGGVVTALDAEKRTVTVALSQGGGEKTFTLTKNANVRIDGKPANLVALPPGANVTLSWFADLTTARTLEAAGPWWQGVQVKAVDAANRTVTVDEGQRQAELAGKTFPVAKDASVTVDGRPTNLATVPPRAFVTLYLQADRKTVHSLQAEGPEYFNVTVKAVDVDRNTVTFADDAMPADVTGKTFPVAKDAPIIVDFRPGKLAGVLPGAVASPRLSVDRKTVRSLAAWGRDFQGVAVKAVDAAKGTITFAEDQAPAELAGRTLPVVKHAAITIDSRPGKLAELPAGASANVTLCVDQKTVLLLTATGSQVGAAGAVVVRAVDPGKNTVTVDIDTEGEKTFTLAPDAPIQLDGKPGKLASVPRDAFVTLTLSVDGKTVRALQAKGLQAPGVLVKAVDAATNTITFAEEAAPAQVAGKTFPVAKDATIIIDGKPGVLAGVPPGASVWLGLSVDQKTAVGIQAEGPVLGAAGGVVVQGVDPGKQTITVDINGEGEKSFPVAKDAHIRIDGKPGRLAQVPKEAGVGLRLSADQKTVLRIEVKSP